MERRKTVKRKAVGWTEHGCTQRGNPRDYKFYLDCGHVRYCGHCPTSVVATFCICQFGVADMGCFDCATGEEVNFKDLMDMPQCAFHKLEEVNPEMYSKLLEYLKGRVEDGES